MNGAIVSSMMLLSAISGLDYMSGANVAYKAFANENGFVFKAKNETIYIGKKCDAYSKKYGKGHWGWANGGVLISFAKKQIGFPRQESPFSDSRCPL